MLTDHALLKLLCSHQFFSANRHRLSKSMLPSEYATLFKVFEHAHQKYSKDLTTEEVRSLIRVIDPVITSSRYSDLCSILDYVQEIPHISPEVGQDVLMAKLREDITRRMSEVSLEMSEGKLPIAQGMREIDELRKRLESNLEVAPDDIHEMTVEGVFQEDVTRYRWKFNLLPLAQIVPGVSAGEFMWWMARSNVGKSTLWVSFCCAPGGWLDQGARVLCVTNEEPKERYFRRCVQAYAGMTQDECYVNTLEAAHRFAPVRSRIIMRDQRDVPMTLEAVESLCQKHRPDILILDILDKFEVPGNFARSDERLTVLYHEVRNIAVRHSLVAIGCCQAGADAHGKLMLDFNQAADSKTGKASAADLALGIGKRGVESPSDVDDGYRMIRVMKNKCNSNGEPSLPVKLNIPLGRFEA